jgi:hypothetical protein
MPTGESHFIIPLSQMLDSFGNLGSLENVKKVLREMYRRSANFLDTDLHGMKFEIDNLAEALHSQGRNTIPAIIAGLFEKNALGEGKIRWGDKTPYYALHLKKILQMFPKAQIIHLIRDGRDVALSVFGRKHDFGIYNTYVAAQTWKKYVEEGHETGDLLGSDAYLEVRYEDILAHPKMTLEKICSFLGEEYSDDLINFKKSGGPGKTPLLQRPIQEDNSNKWRTQMKNRQIQIFESVAGSTLKKFDYPLITTAEPLPLLLETAYETHNRIAAWCNRKFSRNGR